MPLSHNQTLTFLKQRFAEVGIRPDKRRGQNFLIDLNLQDLLASTADVGPRDVVLEVGTGTGALTAQLAERAAWVVTIEIAPQLYQLASEQLIDYPNVTILHQDALKNKNTLHPNLIAAVRERLVEEPDCRFKLAANLPYSIATPVLSNLLSSEIVPDSMTVTIQKELADRIMAPPGAKDYNALSIWVQCQCHTSLVRVMPPSVFWPRPKVNSAIIQIVPDQKLRDKIPDLDFFHTFVRSVFLHRRKFLRSVILSAFKKRLGKPEVDEIMGQLGLGADSRAEQLNVRIMLALCEAVRSKLGD